MQAHSRPDSTLKIMPFAGQTSQQPDLPRAINAEQALSVLKTPELRVIADCWVGTTY
jgi:hypothetical protein